MARVHFGDLMHAPMAALLQTFRRFDEADAESLVVEADPGSLPSPWLTWSLICLVRHRKRQHWVAEIVRQRLQGDVTEIAAMGSFGHPHDVPQSGTVPGLPEWEYYFHGRGCCVTHKVNGESIDVDFYDDSPDYFDVWFFQHYLKSLRTRESPEQRLYELDPSKHAITFAVDDLVAAGALTPLPGRESKPCRLSDEVVAVSDDIERFCDAWTDPSHHFVLACLIGDWLAAEESGQGRADVAEVTRLADECRTRWRQRLSTTSGNFKAADALRALADLKAPDLEERLVTSLQGPPSGIVSAALEIIEQQDDPVWCPHVYSLFLRVDPSGQIPSPRNWMASLRFLVRHGYNLSVVLPALSRAGGCEVGEATLLALQYAPELALPLVRKSLLDDVPINRTEVAAILALLDTPWSKRELYRALEHSRDNQKTADVRAALLELGDPEAEQAVLNWEKRNPRKKEKGSYIEVRGRMLGPFYSFRELDLQNRAARIAYEMQQLHDRVMPLKHVIPPEPPQRRRWWQLWKSRGK